MSTPRTFLVILYTSHAFYACSVTSQAVQDNKTNMPEHEGYLPPTSQQRSSTVQPAVRIDYNETNKQPTNDFRDGKPMIVGQGGTAQGTLSTQVTVEYSRPVYGWHVTVYSKIESQYEQICGGSLVKKNVAISAAHCFWDEAGLIPAEQFGVTVGQTRRQWKDAWFRSNVSEIVVPPRFQGILTSFQDDIAVVRMATPAEYQIGVKPVCVDFDLTLERKQLASGRFGTITGFGLTEENGEPSEVLNFQRLPYVDIRDCINASDPSFLKYLTSDKICAGDQQTGRALCRGDSGGGLVFTDQFLPADVYYLRGVASAAPRNNNKCNAFAIGSFTHVRSHRTFLREHIPGLEEECKLAYAKEFMWLEKPNAPIPYFPPFQPEPFKPTFTKPSENKPDPSVDLPRLSDFPSVPRFRGNPTTNIIFFPRLVEDPSNYQPSYQPNAAPAVAGRPEQPVNIYVLIQN